MIALRRLLAPAPRVLTPERTALATVAILAAAATPPVIASIGEVQRELHGSVAAALVIVVTTVTLSVVLARRALAARSPVRARAWLVLGGFLAGTVDAATSYAGVVLLRADATLRLDTPGNVLFGSLLIGGPLGCLFGIAYAPVVAAAVRARVLPSIDAGDRVLFAAGASLLGAFGLWKLASPPVLGPPVWAIVGLTGALAATAAAVRLVARLRLLRRARDGAELGFHVVPRSGQEDESQLLPLVRAGAAPGGVLAATGVSAPYRGARGVFKLALAPLPEEPFDRPLRRMVRGALREIGHAALTAVVGAVGVWMVGMLVFLAIIAQSGGG